MALEQARRTLNPVQETLSLNRLTAETLGELELSNCSSLLNDYFNVQGLKHPSYTIEVLPGSGVRACKVLDFADFS